jgi:cephalosporin-C deacetylase-like acetyl esterase
MRVRTDVDRIRSLVITSYGETDHYGEMMKAYIRSEKARIPLANYSGITVARWLPKRREIRRRLAEAVGPFPGKKVPLKAKVNKRYDRDGYTIEGVSFYTRPNWPVSSLLYLPKKGKRPYPAVLLVHGHSFAQKAYTVYQKVAVHLARNGYAVLAVDFVGGGERTPQRHENLYMYMAGQTVQGLMVWDNMRAIDYLMTRREIDPRRIGITGSSGGGNQTAFTTVFDERIAASAPVNAVCMFDEHMAIGIDSFCQCEVIPGIWQFAEYSDLMATVAPRPLLICQAVKDRLFPIKGAREVYYRAREVYRAFGVEDRIGLHEDYGPHSYAGAIRVGVIRFFDKYLKGIEPASPESYEDYIAVENEASEVLHAFPGGQLPAGTETLATFYGKLSEDLPRIKRPKTKAAYKAYRNQVLRHLSRLAGPKPDDCDLEVQEFPTVEASWGRIRPFAFMSERGVVVPSILIEPKNQSASRVVVYVNDSGKAHALDLRSVELLVRGGAAVLAMDLRGTGETAGHQPGEASIFTLTRTIMLGRHLSLMRAFDVSRGIDAVKELAGYGRLLVSMWAEGEASMVGLFAFALDKRIKRFAAADLLLTFRSKEKFKQSDYIMPPGMLIGADVADLLATSIDREVLIARGELPSGANVSRQQARSVLAPAFAAAKTTGLAAPIIAAGGYEAVEDAIRRFLLG